MQKLLNQMLYLSMMKDMKTKIRTSDNILTFVA